MAKIRVLLAEDHETVRVGLRMVIDAEPDLEVVGEAADGEAALQGARELRPDVLVMDISMPGMNGVQATERVGEACRAVRVLILSRYAEEAYLRQLLRAGAAGYVLKQSRPAELLNGIRAVAGGQKYLDPAIAGKVIREYVRGPEAPPAATDPLTSREEEVLRLVARGFSNKEIANSLTLSVKTVESHKTNAQQKLGLRSRIEIVRLAVRRGWLQDT